MTMSAGSNGCGPKSSISAKVGRAGLLSMSVATSNAAVWIAIASETAMFVACSCQWGSEVSNLQKRCCKTELGQLSEGLSTLRCTYLKRAHEEGACR